MQHIENDMDDLFSKAGDNYPLDTSGSNWESVRAALYEGNAPLPAKKTNYRRFLWLLLLLIPFAWINYHNKPTLTSDTHLNANTKEESIAGTIKKSPITNPPSNNTVTRNNNTVIQNNNGSPLSTENKIEPGVISNNTEAANNKENIKKIAPNKSIIKQLASASRQKNNRAQNVVVQNANRDKNRAVENVTINKKIRAENLLGTNKTSFVNEIANNKSAEKQLQYSNLNNILAPLYGSYSNYNIKKQFAQANPIAPNPVSSNNKAKPEIKHQSRLYAGLIVGPDFSYIHSQKVKDVGYSVGISLGYRLNKHFAIELGALYDQKKYFTDGEYFNKTGAGVPNNVRIAWLNGGCNMFEFPLQARYNFNIRKSAFFVSGGLTSYIMKNESYKYSAEANGSWYEGHRSYDNSGNHLFANMQWSLGYNLRLSSTTQLRFEPYIKVPVKNIGIGKLPVTSSGIYFGITRDLK